MSNTYSVDIDRLSQMKLCQGLSLKQVTAISKVLRIRHYQESDPIITEGELGGEMFILLEGTIEISKRLTLYSRGGEDKRDKSLLRLSSEHNVFFGEMSLFQSEQRSATVTARSAVVLGVITREQMNILAGQDPALGYLLFYNIGRTLAENLRHANRDILKLTTAFCLALEGK